MKDSFVPRISVGDLVRVNYESPLIAHWNVKPNLELGVVVGLDMYNMVEVRWLTQLSSSPVWYVDEQLEKVVDSGENSL